MKTAILALASFFILAAPAHAGAVDDSIDCVARGRVSCGPASLTEEVKVENINYNSAEDKKAAEDKKDVEI